MLVQAVSNPFCRDYLTAPQFGLRQKAANTSTPQPPKRLRVSNVRQLRQAVNGLLNRNAVVQRSHFATEHDPKTGLENGNALHFLSFEVPNTGAVGLIETDLSTGVRSVHIRSKDGQGISMRGDAQVIPDLGQHVDAVTQLAQHIPGSKVPLRQLFGQKPSLVTLAGDNKRKGQQHHAYRSTIAVKEGNVNANGIVAEDGHIEGHQPLHVTPGDVLEIRHQNGNPEKAAVIHRLPHENATNQNWLKHLLELVKV